MTLPYARVRYEFSATRLSAPSVTYFGSIIGKATRLHDLTSKGFFTPDYRDCGSGEDYDIIYTDPEFDIPNYDYPALVSGNKVIPESVKAYFQNLKYIGIRKAVSAALNAGNYIAVPVTRSAVKVVKALRLNDAVADGFLCTFDNATGVLTVVAGEGLKTDGSIAFDSGEDFLPSSLACKVTVGGLELLLTDVPHSDYMGAGTVLPAGTDVNSELPVTGQLYVYAAAGDIASIDITRNSLMYEYNDETGRFEFTGGLVMTLTGYGSPDLTSETTATVTEPAPAEAMYNFDDGDIMALPRRGFADAIGAVHTLVLDDGESLYSFAGVDPDFTMDSLRATFLTDPPEGLSDPDHTGYFAITSLDYTAAIVYGSSLFDAGDTLDYRPQSGIAVCIKETARARRLLKNDHYDIVEEGSESELAQITMDPASVMLTTRVRENTGASLSYSEYAPDYDSDPTYYPSLNPTPGMSEVNFISGTLRLEYEESVVAENLINKAGIFRMSEIETYEQLPARIGQFDPRNELGFAVGFTTALTGVDFYVMPYTDLTDALEALKDYRNIFHVWNVADAPTPVFANWLTTENEPRQSRFRIGYQFQNIPTEVTRVLAAYEYEGTYSINSANGRRTFASTTPGVNFLNLSVNPGDKFTFPESDTELTVEFVSSTSLSFVERFTRSMDYGEHIMTGGPSWTYTFPYDVQAGTGRVKFKLRNDSTGLLLPVEGSTADIALRADIAGCALAGNVLTISAAAGYSVLNPKASAVPSPVTVTSYGIYRTLTPTEQTNLLVALQASNDPANVIVLTKDIKYRDGFLPDYAAPALIFAAKITLVPHMPLTDMQFDTEEAELGEVTGMSRFKRDDHLEALGDAGYCMINSITAGKPFCESDFTAGYRLYRESDRGLLSKYTPVLLYGKDTYEITKKFKGPMNTDTPELLNLINLTLASLKSNYTTTRYPLLGTLLKSVADVKVSFDGSFTVIEHRISSQDPSRYVDNIIYVE